ncbi:polysaccharide deacetylase family protein [Actinoplanes awajinensis]|uniref:Glycosyl transferase family 2 n=1 Tax=Actinoplanes awajinensis subsp. mycoplanecinus TaxID=135947 RepID=A0A0X3V5K0_9ACTN|nr:polysaccharide deacetylase family protein [Actinoplanes awajinensis]KUL40010.1 glycosyl transferase family 2 [Actinoplanes awajinensis subsp. mycoplanecinus]
MQNDTVINICFHGIGTPQRELEPGEDRYWISEDLYAAVLDEIREWPSVRISFDDGNASDAELGLPGLVERGLTAEFFVLASRLDAAGSLSTEQIHALQGAGMAIGTHGMWHKPWRGMDAATSDVELVTAREQIAAVTGTPVTTAACPLGRYDRQLLTRMRALGYTRVFTSDRRKARANAWLQPRYSVRRDDTPASLRAEALVGPGVLSKLKLEAVGAVKRLR